MAGFDFTGKTVWVTGAGKGIGYATARAFVEAGAQVTGFDLAFPQEAYPLPPKRWTSRMPHRSARCAARAGEA